MSQDERRNERHRSRTEPGLAEPTKSLIRDFETFETGRRSSLTAEGGRSSLPVIRRARSARHDATGHAFMRLLSANLSKYKQFDICMSTVFAPTPTCDPAKTWISRARRTVIIFISSSRLNYGTTQGPEHGAWARRACILRKSRWRSLGHAFGACQTKARAVRKDLEKCLERKMIMSARSGRAIRCKLVACRSKPQKSLAYDP